LYFSLPILFLLIHLIIVFGGSTAKQQAETGKTTKIGYTVNVMIAYFNRKNQLSPIFMNEMIKGGGGMNNWKL
jgi:hypothetical protein